MATGVFLIGYLVVWTAFSLLAALAQWALHGTALLSPMMVSTSPVLGGTLLMTVRRSSAWSVPSIARAAGLRRFRASTARRRDTGRMVKRSARSSFTIRVGMISKSNEP